MPQEFCIQPWTLPFFLMVYRIARDNQREFTWWIFDSPRVLIFWQVSLAQTHTTSSVLSAKTTPHNHIINLGLSFLDRSIISQEARQITHRTVHGKMFAALCSQPSRYIDQMTHFSWQTAINLWNINHAAAMIDLPRNSLGGMAEGVVITDVTA